jgi:hypothetical protein
MMQITVIRDIPPVIVGSCGLALNRAFEAFEAELDALEYDGVSVDRRVGTAKDGDLSLPSVRVNGVVVCEGHYPSRRDWAHAIGEARRAKQRLSPGAQAA